jgi:hypothetical protein
MNLRTRVRSSSRSLCFTDDYPERVMYSFWPDPDPAARDAIVVALERVLEPDEEESPAAYRSAWRQAALDEGVAAADEDNGGL